MRTYIHASILTQENIIPQNSNKKIIYNYSETDMVTKKWHYYFRISDNGIREWRNVKKYMYYAKGWWNFVRIDRKWIVCMKWGSGVPFIWGVVEHGLDGVDPVCHQLLVLTNQLSIKSGCSMLLEVVQDNVLWLLQHLPQMKGDTKLDYWFLI